MTVEFDYCILKDGEITDTCYAFTEIDEEEMGEITAALMEENSRGELADIPEKYMERFVDAALDDALEIYPEFGDSKSRYSVMLQKYLPDDLVDCLPDCVVENFAPEMFEE